MSSNGSNVSNPNSPEQILKGKDLLAIFRLWEETHNAAGYDPVPVLKRLSEIFEEETDIYTRKDPDPFDERHPSRTDPDCELGRSLKLLFRRDHFMTKLVSDYLRDNFYTRQNIQKSSLDLNIAACRLILVIMPGLETSAVFQVDHQNLINRIYSWAEDSIEPLQSYATGLLAAAMEVNDMAVSFRDHNARLVPKMLKRLHMLQAITKSREQEMKGKSSSVGSLELEVNGNASPVVLNTIDSELKIKLPNFMAEHSKEEVENIVGEAEVKKSDSKNHDFLVPSNLLNGPGSANISPLIENDNSVDASVSQSQKAIKKFWIPIHPATTATSQMLILRYLSSLGEYQEVLGPVFEHNAIQIIFNYIENLDIRDTCLAFEALKYLASLLCHKKFALEFIGRGGLEYLLQVPRPSIAATGVSITIYYLAYCEEAMERICAMPKNIVSSLVKYALWLLGRSHDSGKCHATMFFGLSFQFKVILDEFDNQDGLRKLYNLIAVLPILSAEDNNDILNDDEECAARQLVRHVCVAMKKYMESHLFFKYNQVMRQQCPTSDISLSISKAVKLTLEQISDQVRSLQECLPWKAHWAPVDQLLKLGGITLILRIIAYSYEWNGIVGRAETVRSALDVLSICCVVPRVFNAFCDRLEVPDNPASAGINAILGAAIGEILADADVQKSALAVLVHCVCAPLNKQAFYTRFGLTKRKIPNRYNEEIVEKIWESVCSNNGIIVLLQLMQVKTPITDADCIRGMACRALAGLARSERVRQIIGKLPLFASGQIQHLMRDPILQEKRAEHVIFQKYALELLERVSGKAKTVNNMDASLANIHRANVVAQTRIQYNEKQLMQLIYEHLESKGMSSTAGMLMKEAGLQPSTPHVKSFHSSPFSYKIPTNPVQRSRIRSRPDFTNITGGTSENASIFNQNNSTFLTMSLLNGFSYHNTESNRVFHFNGNNANNMDEVQSVTEVTATTPIKLKKLNPPSNIQPFVSNVQQQTSRSLSLQKQILPGEDVSSSTVAVSQIEETTQQNSRISLSTIVTEYLTNQHALCNNPISTCPQFDLFKPHKCPDPKPNRVIDIEYNLTARLFKAQSGFNTMRFDRRYVHSNFRLWKTIRSQTSDYPDVLFTCCDIMPCTNLVIAGTQQGEAKIFNINEGNEGYSAPCHSASIEMIKCNRDGTLVLTSASWRSPLSVLWSVGTRELNSKLQFDDDFYVEFANLSIDKALGTKTESSSIYDLNTGQVISTFKPSISNQYTKNRGTFCPTDELILSDGVLFDVKSGREIHKFDKLNQTLSGVFHPNGLEIISNTEVWDLRTFHLLQTIPVLDQCLIKFSPQNVIYGFNGSTADDGFDLDSTSGFTTSFKVLDGYDYSSISTIDVKKNIYDLSVNKYGSFIALVENLPGYENADETFLKIYAVGMKKNEEEEEEEELETDEEGSESDDSQVIFNLDDFLAEANGVGRRPRRRNRRNENAEENDSSDEWQSLESLDVDENEDEEDAGGSGGDDEEENNDFDDDMAELNFDLVD
ncbi:protein mahjong isoform X2 [Condylostylus longicornis]|uniref:protein mahjong isoform X2 n=1 Tax=Condylostylus longicornis TaxID=2530218 RepID=UPI00244DBC3A|nr:protein mahjong isoform X2 [Condylostylus longicornis]